MLIALLAPSRGRPSAMAEMIESARSTAEGPIEIWAYLDVDDPSRLRYEALGLDGLTVGPRTKLSTAWNELAAGATRGEILHQAADDIRYRTPGWDARVREAFERYPDRIAFVYTRDGMGDEKLGTHGFVHRRWLEVLGYWLNPAFSDYYTDTWNHDVARRAERLVYLPDVLIEHLHPLANKAQWDATYLDRKRRGVETQQAKTRFQRTEKHRALEAKKLEAACES